MSFLAQATATYHAADSFGYYALLSTLYGIVEGLTEFLPISSTAHLRIVEDFTGIHMESGYWKMYSVVIQLGAILSVPLLFKDRILQFVRTFPRGTAEDPTRSPWAHPLSLVLIGFAVTAAPCYFADHYIGKNLESILMMSLSLVIGGIIMWVVDALCTRPIKLRLEAMTIRDAVWIGLVQILSAVFPGTSRSMSTIAAGQLAGLSRSTALEYSFFLSIPTMLAATGYKLVQALLNRPRTTEEFAAYNAPPGQWGILAIGFIVSFIVAWAVNRWFINWVKKRGFLPFALYRIIFGSALLVYVLTRGS